MSGASLFEAVGGEPVLRPIIRDFVARVCEDVMIGFFFAGVDRERLERMEYLYTARLLGADVEYPGKTIRAAHKPHPIMGGQFDRRKQILRETIERAGVAPEIRDAWLEHVESLRGTVTRDPAGTCDTPEGPTPRFEIKP